MNSGDRIESALRRRPTDERDYDEPLRSSPPERRRTAVPALLVACLVLVFIGAGLMFVRLTDRHDASLGQVPASSGELIGCWGRPPAFSPSLLEGEGTAEEGDSPAARALNLLLADQSAQDLPKTGWHVVVSTPDEVEFVTMGPEIVEVDVHRGGQGQWTVDGWSVGGYGGCYLEVVPPTGYGSASWILDPSAALTPDSDSVAILVTEQGCASGRTPPADAIRADVAYTDSTVALTVAVRSPEGMAQTCQGNPSVPYIVKLDQPLGRRSLLDGGTWPPVPMALQGVPIVMPSPSPVPASLYTVRDGDTVEIIAPRFNYQTEELELANPGIDMSKLEPGQQIRLPLAHEPIDCGADANVEPAGFFKVASMSTAFDVYCPVLPDGWSVASSNEGQLNGSPADRVEIDFKGPNGETLTLVQGKFGEAVGAAAVKRAGPTIGPAKLADRDGTLGGSNGSYYIFTAPEGEAMWEMVATGMAQDQFVSIAGSMILVGK